MTIPTEIAEWLQRHLSILCEDDLSIGHFASGKINSVPDGTRSRWQLSIDSLYRLLVCDLAAVHEYIECSDQISFFDVIRARSPYERGGVLLWNGTLIYGTTKLEALARSFFDPLSQGQDVLNPGFIESLEKTFSENGVAWSEKPLLSIIPVEATEPTPPRG